MRCPNIDRVTAAPLLNGLGWISLSPWMSLLCLPVVAAMGCTISPIPKAFEVFGGSDPSERAALAAALTVPDTFFLPPSAADRAEATTLREQGIALRNQGQLDAAIAALQAAVHLDPETLGGYVILGWTQHLAQQRAAAETTLLRALRRDPQHVPALNALGIVYLVDGQLEAAVDTHRQAQQLTPDNEIAAYNLSLAYQRLKMLGHAIDQATRATQLEPHNPHPWVALAIAYYSNNDLEQAQQAYGQALQLDGRYRDRSFLDHLGQAGFSPEQIELTAEVATLN